MLTRLARRYTSRIVDPLARFLIRLGVTPNSISVAGIVLMAGVSVLLATGYHRWAGLFMILATSTDAFDGAVARLQGSCSTFGAFLDSTLDRYSEAIALLGLQLYFLQQSNSEGLILTFVALVGSLMVSYTRARAEGVGLECKGGLLTRMERVLLLSVALLINQLRLGLWLLAVLSNATAVQRIVLTWRASRQTEQAGSQSGQS